jgi:hypothetical protein
MTVSVAILLGCGVGALVVAWYAAIARLYRSEVLPVVNDFARAVIAALVGLVFVAPAVVIGCYLFVARIARLRSSPLDGSEFQMNSVSKA